MASDNLKPSEATELARLTPRGQATLFKAFRPLSRRLPGVVAQAPSQQVPSAVARNYAGAAPTAAFITNHSSGTWLFPPYQGNGRPDCSNRCGRGAGPKPAPFRSGRMGKSCPSIRITQILLWLADPRLSWHALARVFHHCTRKGG